MEINIEKITKQEWISGFVSEINVKVFLKHPEYFTSIADYVQGLEFLERFAEQEFDALDSLDETKDGYVSKEWLDFAVAISLSSDSDVRAEREGCSCSCFDNPTNVLELSPEEFEKLPDEIRGFAMAFLDFMEEHFSDEIPQKMNCRAYLSQV